MGAAAGSVPELNFQLQFVHTTTKIKLKAGERDSRIDLLRRAGGLPPPDRSKPSAADVAAAKARREIESAVSCLAGIAQAAG